MPLHLFPQASALAASLALSGCMMPKYVTVQGQVVREDRWRMDSEELQRRAKFEFKCSSSPALSILKVDYRMATVVGVDACGNRATYVREIDSHYSPSTWVLNAVGGRVAQPRSR